MALAVDVVAETIMDISKCFLNPLTDDLEE